MDIRRNDPAALPRFAALNAAWIEDTVSYTHLTLPTNREV